MPKSILKKKMEEKKKEKEKMRNRVIVKTYPSYPTGNEYWQAQVKSDPSLNEKILPGTLSGISEIPDSISKWIERNCRFAAVPAPGIPAAPPAGSVPATPAEGEAPETADAEAKASEAQELLNSWGTELSNMSTQYETVFTDLNRLNYGGAARKIGTIITRLQGPMSQLAGQMEKNDAIKGYATGEITNDVPDEGVGIGGEPTGMAAIQQALYDIAQQTGGGGPLGWLLNYETQFTSHTIPPIFKPGLNPQVIKALQNAGYIQLEQNFILLTKRLESLKNMPFKPIIDNAAKMAGGMMGIITNLGSTRNVRTTK